MRFLLLLSLACFSFLAVPGCGPSRPDPRENPDFDEEAYNDANVMPGDLTAP
ncbi:hypothetical protein [Roseimaritima ulvae]|uniref:Uncharacterized protein n=1 Tax=Roseimaritima ulvae TaxID=980254 RepID=A0A5B9RA41_9BACT|nr:hypothetical protein [Roseimaritima ulvae]QEG43753.1 hypothetical protein UC8_58070 [Roseimaritima ulvae]